MSVSVCIVTFNSRRFIVPCLDSLFRQSAPPIFEIIVVDNASTDGTRDLLEAYRGRIQIIHNETNLGFAAAQNQAIAASQSDWVLALNPDVVVLPGFLETLVQAGEDHPQAGVVCGKLLAIGPDLQPSRVPRIDSAGMYFTPAMRHFDRGWHEPAAGRYEDMEYVFGASAAAAFYRREMIADIAPDNEFFDPDFFAYREDADIAWRAQLAGWDCLYVPAAEAYHVRSVVQGNRRDVPADINMHSVKNRFVMRIKNMTGGVYRRFWWQATARDLVVIGGCLLSEPSSLRAFWRLGQSLGRTLQRRKIVMSRRRVDDAALARWFRVQSLPLRAVEDRSVTAAAVRAPTPSQVAGD